MTNKNKSLMSLDKLIQSREQKPPVAFPIPEEEVCERYERLYTGAICDVLREFCLVDQVFPPEIHPLRDEMKVCGFAYTIKSSKDPWITGEMETRAQMLDEMPNNCICVWETGGETESAHWGEIMTASAKAHGARGAVIEGGLRDTMQVLAQHFPVFYKYRTANGTLSRCRITSYNVPVKIGKVIIYPGDLIFGDIDGCLVVPREIAMDVPHPCRGDLSERKEYPQMGGGRDVRQGDCGKRRILLGKERNMNASDLKITDIRFCDIDHMPKRCTLIKVYTNAGIEGYGEVRDAATKTYALMLKSRLLGENPLNVEKLFRRVKQFGHHSRQGGGVSGV